VRAALYDHAGRMVPRTLARRDHERPGSVEFDAEELFAIVCDVIDENVAKDVTGEVVHIASCAFWHSLVGIDAEGKPTTKVLTWADTRSREHTEILRTDLNERVTHLRTGARFHSSFWPAKLLWLKGGSERVPFKTTRWRSFSDLLTLKFCGNPNTSISMASATGIFDQRKGTWDAEFLRYLKLKRTQLPAITAGGFELLPRFKRRWPRLKNALWLPSVGDGAASNIGTGCGTKNRAALTLGTTGALRVVYEGDPPKRLPPGLWCYRMDENRVIVGGALSDGGGLYQWLKKTLRIDLDDNEIGREMARRGADAHGLTVMPFFFGERSTGYNENARGAILGLTASHDVIDILQAAMEAVAYRFAEILDQLGKVTKIGEIVASGGALNAAPVWPQIIADILGRDLLVSKEREPSMLGAVLLALEGLRKVKTSMSLAHFTERLMFHPKCHEIYKNARARHVKLYQKR